MTRFSLRLPRHQARLVALAVAYHLDWPSFRNQGVVYFLVGRLTRNRRK